MTRRGFLASLAPAVYRPTPREVEWALGTLQSKPRFNPTRRVSVEDGPVIWEGMRPTTEEGAWSVWAPGIPVWPIPFRGSFRLAGWGSTYFYGADPETRERFWRETLRWWRDDGMPQERAA